MTNRLKIFTINENSHQKGDRLLTDNYRNIEFTEFRY